MKKYIPAFTIALAFVVIILIMRGVGFLGYVWVAAIFGGAALAFWKREALGVFFRRKFTEWRNDARQLGLWVKLAFSPKDKYATATMAHQQQALVGRMMSPMNLFPVAIGAILLLPLLGGFSEWRINRVKAERDAPCSDRELTRDRDGNFQTDREACASLGATNESARGWRDRAIEAEAARIREVASIRMETDLAVAAEEARRQRQVAATQRQRRRQNEAITAALGGPSPDLDRSLCELAGGTDCDGAGAEPGAAELAAPSALPLDGGNADPAATADTPS